MAEQEQTQSGSGNLLEGKRALVTGAGGRIGRAITELFLAEGAAVAAVDVNGEAVEASVRNHPSQRACAIGIDVSDPGEVERAISQAESALGQLDTLVNCHGIFPNCPLLDVTVDEWDRVFAVNVRGTMLMCQVLGRLWVERGTRGSIVNISSGAATSARAGGAHYAGSKAAINMLTQTLAIELGRHGIRVNAVSPGLVSDEVVDEHNLEGRHPYIKLSLQALPLGRTGRPVEIAEAVAFLASDRSAWTTGANLEVTGGSHCGRPQMPPSNRGMASSSPLGSRVTS